MNPSSSATVTVHGPRQLLRAFRKRLVESLRAEAASARVVEAHQEERLEFSLTLRGGIPFPPLVATSGQYPDCVVTVHWEIDGAQGETTIQNGQVRTVSETGAPPTWGPTAISLGADGSLGLGVAIVSAAQSSRTLGYAATRDAETFFLAVGAEGKQGWFTTGGDATRWDEAWRRDAAGRWHCEAASQQVEIGVADLRELEAVADAFRAHALWYAHAPLEDTIVERTRAAEAGRPVCAINVKSRVVAELGAVQVHEQLGACKWTTRLLLDTWAANNQPA